MVYRDCLYTSASDHVFRKWCLQKFGIRLGLEPCEPLMEIWVDGDACPVVIKNILYKAAERTATNLTLVANQSIKVPPSKYIRSVQVMPGFDVADNEIVRRVNAGDLVITNDIPLADEVLTKGAQALSPRGELFTRENIKSRLNMRDFMDTLRSSGIQTGGPSSLSQGHRKCFADQLDKWLAKKQSARPGSN